MVDPNIGRSVRLHAVSVAAIIVRPCVANPQVSNDDIVHFDQPEAPAIDRSVGTNANNGLVVRDLDLETPRLDRNCPLNFDYVRTISGCILNELINGGNRNLSPSCTARGAAVEGRETHVGSIVTGPKSGAGELSYNDGRRNGKSHFGQTMNQVNAAKRV